MAPWFELQLLPYAFPGLRNLEDYLAGPTVLEDYLEPYCLDLSGSCIHTTKSFIYAGLMRKWTPEILSKLFASKPISGLSKPFAHQKLGPISL